MEMRINVVGTSGCGKSTVAKRIAERLNVPYIQLDELYWKPNWVESLPCPSANYPSQLRNINSLQLLATQWLRTYNNERPHTAIGGIPPRWLQAGA